MSAPGRRATIGTGVFDKVVRMEWGFLLGLGASTLVVIGVVIYFGLKLNRAVQRQTPEIDLPLNITPSGNALFACLTGFLVLCLATRALKPESSLGTLLSEVEGVAAVVIGSLLFAGVAGAVLEKLGYPIAKRGDHR